MKITSKGQVTVPQDVREKTGILPHTEVKWVVQGKRAYLEKVKGSHSRGERLIKALRNSKARRDMTTDEIMALTRGE